MSRRRTKRASRPEASRVVRENPESGSKIPALGEICEVVEALAQNEPLLLVLEDLHWADASTLDLISALARRRGNPNSWFWPATVLRRSTDSTPSMGLKEDLSTRHLCCEIVARPVNSQSPFPNIYCSSSTQTPCRQGWPASCISTLKATRSLWRQHLSICAARTCCSESRKMASQRYRWQRLSWAFPDGLLGMIDLQLGRLNEKRTPPARSRQHCWGHLSCLGRGGRLEGRCA